MKNKDNKDNKVNKKIYFASIPKTQNTWKDYREQNKGKLIRAGEDNLFPEYIISLYNKSSIHAAAVNATVEAMSGGGLTANQESFIDVANLEGESWNDIFNKVNLDYYLHGSFALEVIWSNDGEEIAEVYHIDYSKVRAQEKNKQGKIVAYYLSNNWKRNFSVDNDEVWMLPTFDPKVAGEEGQSNQLFVASTYRPGQNYYALPTYNGALKVIELDTEIDNFHINNIQNGLTPSIAVTTFMDGTDEEVASTEKMLRSNYGGTNNAGALIYMDVASKDLEPTITPIPQNGADGYYTAINDLTVQKILTGHRITSPMILGIKTEGQLGGRSEILDAMVLWKQTVIEPLQADVLRQLEKILEYNFPDIVLGIETKQLFEDGVIKEDTITSVETTDSEDKAMQEPSSTYKKQS